MGFLDDEKMRMERWKKTTSWLSAEARGIGMFRRKPYSFALPSLHAGENLFGPVREAALDYFRRERIVWHQGQSGLPSTHLCDGQVCCVNFLFAFNRDGSGLVELFRSVLPEAEEALSMDTGQLVSFEWIGGKNYLGEHGGGGRIAGDRARTRGAYFTSPDAAVRFRMRDGSITIVLIEWKYTEKYNGDPLVFSRNGTDRTSIYRVVFEDPTSPIDRSAVGDFATLFYEPFYQFMRQQLLAHGMEKAKELGANKVMVLHLAPSINTDFQRITAPALRSRGPQRATDVWKSLLRRPDRFISMSIEEFFRPALVAPASGLRRWRDYITERYGWASAS